MLGAPLDLTESFRSGTGEAPTRVRLVSDVLETYSPELRADLADLPLADWGDVALDGADMASALDRIATAVDRVLEVGLPLIIGGEHTATLGAIRAAHRRFPGLQIIHVDAHTDLRDEYEGLRDSHATVMRRVAEELGAQRICQYGIRSGTRAECEFARQCLQSSAGLEMPRMVRDRIHMRPVYLTVDIDVLDPSCAPGTGCPEPGGATFSELVSMLYTLRGLNVIAVDVMEVLPAVDANDITSIAAAKLLREAALAFGTPRRRQ